MLTPTEIAVKLDRFTQAEIDQMVRQIGLGPECKCIQRQRAWLVRVNKFIRAVEASRN
jgi:hypothetical protein